MATGKVKFVNYRQRFAFIIPDDGGSDLYVKTKSAGERLPLLKKRDKVSYDVAADPRNGKAAAANLKKI